MHLLQETHVSSVLQLWLTVAEKHLQSRGVDWDHAERFCFNEWSNPDDDELGVQIVKVSHFLLLRNCQVFFQNPSFSVEWL
jgi:hypothetical protein